MAKPATLYLFASVVALLLLGLIVFLAILSVSISWTSASTGGISAVAGGVSGNLFLLMVAAVPVLVFLFLVIRKVVRRGSNS